MTDKRKQLWLEQERTVLVMVDVQERLTPAMRPDIFTKGPGTSASCSMPRRFGAYSRCFATAADRNSRPFQH